MRYSIPWPDPLQYNAIGGHRAHLHAMTDDPIQAGNFYEINNIWNAIVTQRKHKWNASRSKMKKIILFQ